MSEHEPDGFRAPITQALVEPMTLGGVPRAFFIANCCTTGFLVLGWHWWWVAPLALGLHVIVKLLTTHDPWWLEVVQRYMQYRRFYQS